MWSRLGWQMLLALVMLLMQQAGLRHSLTHATRDDSTPTHTACLECLAHHASDHSMAHTVPVLLLASFDHVRAADAAQPQCGHSVQTGYLPRAPPVFSA
jgi:hypothetical protein